MENDLLDNQHSLTTLKNALASYDETINILDKLSSDNDNSRTLACAYINRGNVLQALGK